MGRVCAITGKHPSTGNRVSHSQHHTKRWFKPNIKRKRIMVEGRLVRMKVSTRALRTLAKKGGL